MLDSPCGHERNPGRNGCQARERSYGQSQGLSDDKDGLDPARRAPPTLDDRAEADDRGAKPGPGAPPTDIAPPHGIGAGPLYSWRSALKAAPPGAATGGIGRMGQIVGRGPHMHGIGIPDRSMSSAASATRSGSVTRPAPACCARLAPNRRNGRSWRRMTGTLFFAPSKSPRPTSPTFRSSPGRETGGTGIC